MDHTEAPPQCQKTWALHPLCFPVHSKHKENHYLGLKELWISMASILITVVLLLGVVTVTPKYTITKFFMQRKDTLKFKEIML